MKNFINKIYQYLDQQMEACFFFEVLEKDMFTFLDTPKDVVACANFLKVKTHQACAILNVLIDLGYVVNQDFKYQNTIQSHLYLSTNTDMSFRSLLLYRYQKMQLSNLFDWADSPDRLQLEVLSFKDLAKYVYPEMKLFRVDDFLIEVKQLFKTEQLVDCIDLGGGNGVLSMALKKTFPEARVRLIDQDTVLEVARQTMAQDGIDDIELVASNFFDEPIDGQYNLIIASGILNFAKDQLLPFLKKLRTILKPGGYIFVYSLFLDESDENLRLASLRWLKTSLNSGVLPLQKSQLVHLFEQAKLVVVKKTSDQRYPLWILKRLV